MDIEFATNEELIQELMNRATFAGVVVMSKKERKPKEVHDEWNVHTSLDIEQTKFILEHALDQTISHGGEQE